MNVRARLCGGGGLSQGGLQGAGIGLSSVEDASEYQLSDNSDGVGPEEDSSGLQCFGESLDLSGRVRGLSDFLGREKREGFDSALFALACRISKSLGLTGYQEIISMDKIEQIKLSDGDRVPSNSSVSEALKRPRRINTRVNK